MKFIYVRKGKAEGKEGGNECVRCKNKAREMKHGVTFISSLPSCTCHTI